MGKEKYAIEYNMKSAPVMLIWNYISTASGLSQWFADTVSHNGKEFIFAWNKAESHAMQIGIRTGSFIRFRWIEDEDDKYYFELKIIVSELTDSTILIVTDFSDPDDIEGSQELWNHQIDSLKRLIGCRL